MKPRRQGKLAQKSYLLERDLRSFYRIVFPVGAQSSNVMPTLASPKVLFFTVYDFSSTPV